MTPPTWTGTTPQAERIAELESQIEKLTRINAALINRVERATDLHGNAFSLFETAIALEGRVRDRTAELESALADLAASHAALALARDEADTARQRLSDAIESINEGFAIFDAEDRLVLANQTYVSLWPEAADIIKPGVPFANIAETLAARRVPLGALAAPDAWARDRIARHHVADGGQAIALADGRWIQVNEHRTDDGGIVGVYTDITDLKTAEARDRAREQATRAAVLQATLDAMPHGVCLFDAQRKLMAWNGPLLAMLQLGNGRLAAPDRIGSHAAMLAWCRTALPAVAEQGCLDWLDGDSSDTKSATLADGRCIEVHRQPMPSGGLVLRLEYVTQARAAAAAMAQRKSDLEALVAQRTAELERARNQAIAANSSKTRFLAAASHDLLQPLNAARLFVSALSGRRMADGNRLLVGQAASALDSIESLLEALLEISRLDAGAIQPDPRPMPLADLFGALTAEFAAVAQRRGLDLTVEPSGLWVHSDPRLLRRILQNFLSNAVRYTTAGSVTMAARSTPAGIVISVTDTGPGIATDDQALIFEEFRRLGQRGENDSVERGMGLGLAIVQRAARMLDLPIGLVSAPGEGASFSVTVPAAAPASATANGQQARNGAGVGRATVLVIDNEPAILAGMQAVLEGWGCQVLTAPDSAKALAAASRRPVDLLLADYHLADGDTGDAVVERVRHACGRAIPAAILTADRTPELKDSLSAAGLTILNKPVKPAQLRALMGRMLA
ncbi:hybrid sensor histidine kinase/response regulator [Sphingomonas sp. IBVSS1]|nr:hybrid sensor histidine kinase/response regulator [Sphingomonas sp. IBVSS1]